MKKNKDEKGNYVFVARESDIPENTSKTVEVDGKTITIFNNGEEIFAVRDMKKSIIPRIQDKILSLPHRRNITYNSEPSESDMMIKSYKVKVDNGKVFVFKKL